MAKETEETMFRLVWQELKFRRNAIIGWGLGLCFFPVVYLGIYPQVADEMQGLADLEIYQAMGVNLGSLEDWIGSTVILFVPLLVSIYALINSTGTLAGEEEDGRLEMMVTLPLPRWQVVVAKALALSLALLIIILFVSLVTSGVFLAIRSQLETDLVATDLVTALLSAYPLPWAVAMIGLFLAAFSATRRAAALIATAVLIIGYFGSNLAGTVSSLEPLEPLFLFSYLDTTGNALVQGQQPGDLLTLLAIGLVALGLAVFFFQRRNLTVGVWPWQRAQVAK
jgi:ABC-2 type transport system permease protein